MKHVELNERGQVTLPAAERKTLGWEPGDELKLLLGPGGLVVVYGDARQFTPGEDKRLARVAELRRRRQEGVDDELSDEHYREIEWLSRFGLLTAPAYTIEQLCNWQEMVEWLQVTGEAVWDANVAEEGPPQPWPEFETDTLHPPAPLAGLEPAHVEVSPRGQITIPIALRREGDLRTADRFTVEAEGGIMFLVPRERRLSQEDEALKARLSDMLDGVAAPLYAHASYVLYFLRLWDADY